MKITEAMSEKINKILREKDITINKLASISCLTQSTVDSLVNGKSKNPKLLTIIRICDGLGITLSEFFDDELFINVDRED
ncbi:MAG: helix-turn-helix transcriptional regulator [Firmicutes bacterium]|nr:helix-turn-helix transcriptional regulator [Bacillota bacterium]